MKIRKKTLKRFAISMASCAASALVMYTFMPAWMMVMLLTVLVMHEMGHYLMARALGLEVYLPIYIPIPFFALAITYVPKMSGWSKARIAAAGPVFGTIASACFLIVSLLVGANSAAYMAAFLLISEIVWGFAGGDGRAYRKANKREDSYLDSRLFEGKEAGFAW